MKYFMILLSLLFISCSKSPTESKPDPKPLSFKYCKIVKTETKNYIATKWYDEEHTYWDDALYNAECDSIKYYTNQGFEIPDEDGNTFIKMEEVVTWIEE